MGSAPSRMSANPALSQDSNSHEGATSTSTHSPAVEQTLLPDPRVDAALKPDAGVDSAPVDVTHAHPASSDALTASMQPKLDKGKGKQKVDVEKEDGEISEEEEYRIPRGDSWRPPPPQKRDRSFRADPSHSHDRRRPSQSAYTPHFGNNQYKRPRRDSRDIAARAAGAHADRRSTSRSPLETAIPLPPTRERRRVSAGSSVASGSTNISPLSNSLALPDRVNPDEAEQYMDIIRNLIHDGIDPEVLIKRGATRRYVMAACEEIVAKNKKSATWTQIREPIREDSTEAPESEPAAGPSRLRADLLSPSPDVIEMARIPTDSSFDIEMGDEVERMLSPPKPIPQKLKPSSSWAPPQPTTSASTHTLPFHVESYKPVQQAVVDSSAPAQTSSAPRPTLDSSSASSHRSFPRPVSSYTPGMSDSSSTRQGHKAALAGRAATDTPPRDPLAPIAVPPLGLKVELQPSPSPLPIPETLAERKKRVMESMKRGRKGSTAPSAPATGNTTPLPTPPTLPSPPPILQPTPVPHPNAKLEDEVAALEREVMGLQDADIPMKPGSEEGEIVTSNEPSPVRPAQPLPDPTPPIISTATTLVNGVRPIRMKKRPQAEDLMDSRATSTRPAWPAVKRPFGRPINYARLQVRLDSDDEAEDQKPVRDTPPPSDAERAKLEEDIRLLKEKIEKRRLARLAEAKEGPTREVMGVEVQPPEAASAVQADVDMVEHPVPEPAPVTINSHEAPADALPITSSPHLVAADDHQSINASSTPGPKELLLTPSNASTTGKPGLTDSFLAYRPILDRYPQLPKPAGLHYPKSGSIDPPSTPPSLSQLDHRLMAHIVLTNAMKRSPNMVVCGAEAAGGTCADPSCADLHIGRTLGRVDDAALVEYLSQATHGKTDHAVLRTLLAKAKQTVGAGGDAKSGGGLTSFPISVAEQLVAKVGQPLQDQ